MLKRKDFFNSTSQYEESTETNRIVVGTELTGDVVSDSNFVLDGEMHGNLSCSGKVVIGSTGKLRGNLVCVNADIEGALDGELTIENLLILRSTARIKGDIQTLKLNIEEGAFFEGACVMKSPVSTNNTFNSDIEFE